MAHTTATTIESALEGRRLLEHPFYRRWEAGELRDGELRAYAEQYRHFEASLPGILEAVIATLPNGAARDAVTDNLFDEIGAPTHLELFDGFADHYGAQDVPASPAMSNLLDAYRDNLAHSNAAALGGILAYEVQGAGIADTKSTGLTEFYGSTEAAATFWRVHGQVEGDHAQWLLDSCETFASDPSFADGARRVADAWWIFLDEREALVAA
jgi:pyrroloquinoline-quinone synthase